jgi:hypothetical protein
MTEIELPGLPLDDEIDKLAGFQALLNRKLGFQVGLI